MRRGGSRQSLAHRFLLWLAIGIFSLTNLAAFAPQVLAQTNPPADPNACTEATTAEALKAGLAITMFRLDATDQTGDNRKVTINLTFTTPKTYNETPKVFYYYKNSEGKRTDVSATLSTPPQEREKDKLWSASAFGVAIPPGNYTFHATVLAKIEGTTKRACTKTGAQQIDLNCGNLQVDRPFNKSKSLLRSIGSGTAVNTRFEFVRYDTEGSRCVRQSSQVSFPSGKKFRILTSEGDDTQLRSDTFYSLYEMLSRASVGGEEYHFYAAVDKQSGILGDVVARKFRGEGNDENEEILSWRLAEKRGIVVANDRLRTLMGNLHQMAGAKVQGYVTGKLREISITADFDIDYSGSEASTKNQKFTGTQTTLPQFQTAEAEMQLWCAYEGQGQNHLFVGAFKFTLPSNPSDGKWNWKTNVFSGSCIISSFLTLTNDGSVPLTGGEPNYTGHGLVGINTERTFEDAVGRAGNSTTDAIYLGLIDRGREDLFAAEQQFAVDKDESKPIAALNPQFKHRATTTDVLGSLDPCNLLALVNVATKDGIGIMLLRMIGCITTQIIVPLIEGIVPYIEEGANYSREVPPISEPTNLARAPTLNPIQEFFLPVAHAQEAKQSGFEGQLKQDNGVIVTVWTLARSLLNIVIIVALLAIAFANIFHLNINTYAAKKALPGLVIGVIGANASLLIIRFLADVVQAVSQLVLDLGGFSSVGGLIGELFVQTAWATQFGNLFDTWTGTIGSIVLLAISPILLIYYLFLVIALGWAMLKRTVILFFLSMIAPLAFAAYGVPQFQSYFFKWWDMILRQLFVWPVLLFGIMITIKIADAVVVSDAVGGTAGVVEILLVLGALHLTLHLPKMMTKGAIDLAKTLKGALGFAPRVAQLAQQGNQAWTSNRKGKLESQLAIQNKLGNKVKADELEKKIKSYEDRSKVRSDRLKGLRGHATWFARPDILKSAYEDRVKRLEKDDYIAAVTRSKFLGTGVAVPSLVRGADAEAELAKKLGLDESKDARSAGDLEDLSKTLFKGHLEAVDKLGVKDAMEKAAGGDASIFERIRQSGANMKSRSEVDDFIEELNKKTGLKLKLNSVKDYHDMMKWSAFQTAVTRVSKSVRETEEGIDPYDKNAGKVAVAFPSYSLKTPPGGGAVPFSGAGMDPAAMQSMAEQGLRNWVKEVFNHSARVAPHLNDELEAEIKRSLSGLGGIDLNAEGGSNEIEQLRTALIGATGGNPMSNDALTKQIFSASGGDLLKVAEQVLQAGEVNRRGGTQEAADAVARERFNQSASFHNQASETLANIDYDKLTDSIERGINIGDAIVDQLRPELEKMANALGKSLSPEAMGKIAQEFNKVNVDQFRQAVSGRDRKSLASVLKNTMETTLTESVSRGLDSHVITPGSMISDQGGTQSTPPA